MTEKEKRAIDVFHPPEGEDVSGEWDEQDLLEIKQMLEDARKKPMRGVVRY